MFVILKDQADVTSAAEMEDYPARRQFVYDTLVENAVRSQQDIRQTLDRFNVDYKPYYLVNAIDVDGSLLVRLWLMTRPEVDRILDNPVLRPLPEPLPVQGGSDILPDDVLWNLSLVEADRVWEEYGVRGAGVIVGQSDSGVQGDHPELADSYRGSNEGDDYNWFDPWNNSSSPVDIGGHGTHTLGSILGNHTGIAPDARWIACVNLARNLANPALYLDCMQFMLAPFPQDGDPFTQGSPARGAHVLNNSWGCPELEGCDANVFQPAVESLRAAGIFVVASAGNDGPACGSLNVPPPIYSAAFAVGAVNRNGYLAPFSSIGPVTADGSGRIKPDLVAPGVDVLSSLPNSTYGRFSGTSMAGPHVVGAVALLWSANPDLIGDIDLTEQYLIESAEPYDGLLPECPGVEAVPSTATGYGVLNVLQAVQLAIGVR
jgi:subtilisin family serine protease